MNYVIRVVLPGLLKNGLEYLTLNVIRELLTTVAPVKEREIEVGRRIQGKRKGSLRRE